jgi:heat-inducible transcriptional repressor
MSDQRLQLTPRQAVILTRVVTEYIQTGHPVGSKALVESGVVDASSSTVRYELAELESRGLLGHPHTSAGRVPTDAGYRLYADQLLEQPLGAAQLPIDLSEVRNEVDAALRSTTEMMSQVTNLLAVVTAPPLETAEIRHVEVLPLQPRVVMVVVITSTGGVTKRMFPFEDAVDAKLVEWANEYLNERLTGVRLGALTLRQRLYDEMRWADLAEINDLMHALEERVGLLRLLRGALESNRLYVRVGAENEIPHLRSLSLVAANYGLPARNLGTVSLIGPMRMDYATAIRSVRGAAALLSEFVEQVYE